MQGTHESADVFDYFAEVRRKEQYVRQRAWMSRSEASGDAVPSLSHFPLGFGRSADSAEDVVRLGWRSVVLGQKVRALRCAVHLILE
jgi:hypothetical protein